MKYDLQFFGDDKTEEPTSKKLDDARKKGQVGKSQELAHAIELIAAFVSIKVLVGYVGENFLDLFTWAYTYMIPELVDSDRSGLTTLSVSNVLLYGILQMFLILLPFLAIGFLVAILSNGLQFKFQVSTEPLKPKLDKFNPINGFKRMFSMQSLMNLALSVVKIVIIFIVAYTMIKDHLNELYLLYEIPLQAAVAQIGTLVLDIGIRISVVLLIVGFVDLFYHKWKYKKDLKMTKQEVKDEYKNAEGDPLIKSKQKQRMREASQRRMMQSVPQADVVITNPTHIAVAIKYDINEAPAPIVVAKGEEYMAQRIKDTAKENNVEIIENKPLARSIYTTVEVGQQIPPELYQAVAEILAVVYQSRGRKA
ncbi:MAG: flagellar biosynthesis protein FlhB [Lachnospiraceae bacterium]|nr:flagellar biosynthesis protein FlhB [Lachnospiraceae bacterium]